MVVSLPDVLLIPYGTAEWSLDAMAIEGFSGRTLRLRTAFPCLALNRAAREPLRFNNSRYDLGFAPIPAGAPDERGLLKDYLKSLCRPWDNLSTQFLDAYFQFASDIVEEQRALLSEKLAPYAGLYDYKDWFFSAPKPIPRAHLFAPQEGSAAGTTADFARVDFAFWLGDRLVAALSSQSFLTPKKAKGQADRLRLAGIEVVPFGPADLARGKAHEFFMRMLGPSLAFWEGDMLPAGPFRTSLLDE